MAHTRREYFSLCGRPGEDPAKVPWAADELKTGSPGAARKGAWTSDTEKGGAGGDGRASARMAGPQAARRAELRQTSGEINRGREESLRQRAMLTEQTVPGEEGGGRHNSPPPKKNYPHLAKHRCASIDSSTPPSPRRLHSSPAPSDTPPPPPAPARAATTVNPPLAPSPAGSHALASRPRITAPNTTIPTPFTSPLHPHQPSNNQVLN